MALDGIFLSCINGELKTLIGSRIYNIYQISSFEVVLVFRVFKDVKKLLISANPSSCRINFTEKKFDNPKVAPSFCMVLRKHLKSAKFISSNQLGLDRVINLEFEAKNEVLDTVNLILAVEIMGKHSNVVLYEKKTKIILGAIKNVLSNQSSFREILPKLKYRFPPVQNKLNILTCSLDKILGDVFEKKGLSLVDALILTLEGFSKNLAEEIAYGFEEEAIDGFKISNKVLVFKRLRLLKRIILEKDFKFLAFVEQNKLKDFYFFDFEKYNSLVYRKKFNSASELLNFFYEERAVLERFNSRTFNVIKFLNSKLSKAKNSLKIRLKEGETAKKKDCYKEYGDLLFSNLNLIKKGQKEVLVLNFYDGNRPLKLNLSPAKTPIQNVEYYYKQYKKAKTAKLKLEQLIESSQKEIKFLENKLRSLEEITTKEELDELILDLDFEFINLRVKEKNKNSKQALKFLTFESSDGFKILCGKTAKQNELLTLKKAKKGDVWVHVKNFSGAHVIVISGGKKISQKAIYEACVIAAFNSAAKFSNNVAVDYTFVENVKKIKGAKNGMVYYVLEKTLVVNPSFELVNRLKM